MHEVEITGVGHGGEGICRIDGQVCFVPYALPGDRLRISIAKRAKGILWGTVDEVLEASPHRQDTNCPVFGTCGGCTWLHFNYPAQAEWKCRIVSDCFERIAKLDVEVGWLEDAGLRLNYRTRATFRGDGERWGFYEGRTHALVDVVNCPLCHPHLNAALGRLRKLKLKLPVEIVVNPEGDEILVWSKSESDALRRAFMHAASPRDKKGRASFFFDGAPVVNGTFSQSSLLLNRLLVGTVHRMAEGAEGVLDLYCGSGNLSLALPAEVAVSGIDHNQAAIHSASGTGRGDFQAGDEVGFIKAIGKGGVDTLILDPPRSGAKRIVPALLKSDAARIIYVSCDPATLARDTATMVQGGWRLKELIAIDLFPHTAHVETVAHFERG